MVLVPDTTPDARFHVKAGAMRLAALLAPFCLMPAAMGPPGLPVPASYAEHKRRMYNMGPNPGQ